MSDSPPATPTLESLATFGTSSEEALTTGGETTFAFPDMQHAMSDITITPAVAQPEQQLQQLLLQQELLHQQQQEQGQQRQQQYQQQRTLQLPQSTSSGFLPLGRVFPPIQPYIPPESEQVQEERPTSPYGSATSPYGSSSPTYRSPTISPNRSPNRSPSPTNREQQQTHKQPTSKSGSKKRRSGVSEINEELQNEVHSAKNHIQQLNTRITGASSFSRRSSEFLQDLCDTTGTMSLNAWLPNQIHPKVEENFDVYTDQGKVNLQDNAQLVNALTFIHTIYKSQNVVVCSKINN